MTRPTIGILMDYEAEGSYSPRPHHALRTHYFEAIYALGGVPVGIPHVSKEMGQFLERLDGVVIPGGEYAFPAEWYVNRAEASPYASNDRIYYDIALVTQALEMNLPVLGICAGMQVLACLNGAQLTGDLHSYYDTDINHWDDADPTKPGHAITIREGSLLRQLVGDNKAEVNSHHKESVVETGGDVVASAHAPDGVIEAIEVSAYRFAVGAQWHPEYRVTAADDALLRGFIDACSKV